jgi:hypothetical protein
MKIANALHALLTACALAFTVQVNAAPILLVDTNGVLTGAKGVDVGGNKYDVRFSAGSCNELFNNCSASAFAFDSYDKAELAGQALLDQVFVNGPDGNFGYYVSKILGCNSSNTNCITQIPYQNIGSNGYLLVRVHHGEYDSITGDGWGGSFVDPGWNFAIFSTPSVNAAIPEPTSIVLFGLAAAGLAFNRRRKAK